MPCDSTVGVGDMGLGSGGQGGGGQDGGSMSAMSNLGAGMGIFKVDYYVFVQLMQQVYGYARACVCVRRMCARARARVCVCV